MGRRSLLVVGLALALVFAAPAAGDDIEDQKAAVDARIAALQAEIAASKQQEGVLTSQLSAVVSELGAAQAAVEQAQSSVGALEAELAAEQERLDRLTALLEEQTRRLERLQAEYRRAVGVLEARVRAIYVEEPPDVLSFLVSASSFDDLIDNYEFVSRIGAQDRQIAYQVAAAKRKAAAERLATSRTRRLTAATVSVISARTDEARAARDRLASNRDTLASARELKRSALVDSRETREEYLSEVEALAAQSAALAAAIRESQAGAGSAGTGAPSAAGLIWPVDGVVVSGFGMRWGRMHEGIDIAAPSERRFGPRLPEPSFTPAGSAATETSSCSTMETASRPHMRMPRRSSSASGSRSPGRDDRARGLDRPLHGAAPPLRGPRQRRGRRPIALSLRAYAASVAARGRATGTTRWRSGKARQRSSRPNP